MKAFNGYDTVRTLKFGFYEPSSNLLPVGEVINVPNFEVQWLSQRIVQNCKDRSESRPAQRAGLV